MVKASTAARYADTHTDTIGAEVGRRIRAARLERGLSLAQVGGDDLSRSFLSLVELGRSRISLRALSIVADRLDLPISHFLDDAPGVSDATVELALDEAENTLRRRVPAEAMRYLERVQPTGPIRPRALWLRGWALADLGRPREAIPVLQDAITVAESHSDGRMLVSILYTLAMALASSGSIDESLIYLRRALAVLSDGPEDPAYLGKITVGIGHILFEQGHSDAALAQYTRARELFGKFGDLQSLAAVYSGISAAYREKGDMPSALRYSKLSLGAAEAKQDCRQASNELSNMAVKHADAGDLELALSCTQEAIERAQRIGAVDAEATAHSTQALIMLRMGDHARALEEARMAERLNQNDDRVRIDAWLIMAEVAEEGGDYAQADDYYRRALHALEGTELHALYAETALAYSLRLRQRGDTDRALEYALLSAQAKSGKKP